MNPNDHLTFQGKPPKSADVIRSLLESIHERNGPRLSGPDSIGIRHAELNALVATYQSVQPILPRPERHDREYYCRMLTHKSTIIGGVAGALLGANIGFTILVVFGVASLFVFSIMLGLLIGAASGTVVARNCVKRLRPDLFRATSFPRTIDWLRLKCHAA